MRYVQKQKVLDFIGSLHQAHEEIKKALEEKTLNQFLRCLMNVSSLLMNLGTLLRSRRGRAHYNILAGRIL